MNGREKREVLNEEREREREREGDRKRGKTGQRRQGLHLSPSPLVTSLHRHIPVKFRSLNSDN